MPNLLSGRTKVTAAENLSASRYTYISPSQAQPAFGKPPFNQAVLVFDTNGNSTWIKQSSLVTGIIPTKNVIFVAKSGNDSSPGNTITNPKATIGSAIVSAIPGTTIIVFSGTYNEINPLVIPDNVAIIGQDTRVFVEPKYVMVDVFKLKSGSAVESITVINHQAPSFAFSLEPSVDFIESPVIKSCSSITGPFLVNGTRFIPNITIQGQFGPTQLPSMDTSLTGTGYEINPNGAGGGIKADGLYFGSGTVVRTLTVEQFYAANQGGIGVIAKNSANINIKNSLTEFCSYSYQAITGGHLEVSNCTSKYGIYGLNSDGFDPDPYILNSSVSQTQASGILTIRVSSGGSGYIGAPTVRVGTPWQANAAVTTNSQIYNSNTGKMYLVLAGGNTSSAAPTNVGTTAFNDGATASLLYTGNVATATATVSGGVITGVTLNTPGTGYTTIPTVTLVNTNGGSNGQIVVDALSGISLITIGEITQHPINGSLAQFTGNNDKQVVSSSTVVTVASSNITIKPNLNYLRQSTTVSFYKGSMIVATMHNFNNIGAGVTYNALPEYGSIPLPLNEIIQTNYGQIFYSSINETGTVNIGNNFTINQLTNTTTVNGGALDLTQISDIGPFIRNGVPVGVKLKEISDNITLKGSTNTFDSYTVPTQNAISQFLSNNYLPLSGGTVTGPTNITNLSFSYTTSTSNATIGTVSDTQSIIIASGNNIINVNNSKLINVVDPQSPQDAATKLYVDLAIRGGVSSINTQQIGAFEISGNSITNTNNNGVTLLANTGAGFVEITSTVDSTSINNGALVVDGGVGIAKNVYVGGTLHVLTSMYASVLIGNVSGSATTVTGWDQSAITKVGNLSDLTVGNFKISGDTIKNQHSTSNLILGVTTRGAVLPELPSTIDFGSTDFKWHTGYFDSLYGTVKTSSQPFISTLSSNVNIVDSTFAFDSTLSIGYNSNNKLAIKTTHTGNKLAQVQFITTTDNTQTDGFGFEFWPNGNLSLKVEDGKVTITNDLRVVNHIYIDNPILTLGQRNRNNLTDNDYGVTSLNNTELNASVTVRTISNGNSTVSAQVIFPLPPSTYGVKVHDYLTIIGSGNVSLDSVWEVISIIDNNAYINVTSNVNTGDYTPTTVLLSRNSFFGYNREYDAFTFIPDATINTANNTVSGDFGYIKANLDSNNVRLTGGTIDNIPIGSSTASTGTFTSVITDEIKARTVIEFDSVDPIVPHLIDSFDKTSVDLAKYIIKIKNTTNGSVTAQELILVHDSTNILMNEYAILNTTSRLGYMSGLFGTGNLIELYFTPNDAGQHFSISIIRFYA